MSVPGSSFLLGAIAAFSITAQAAVVEFFNPDLNNYFITAERAEQDFIDTGAVGRWLRTGNAFAPGGPNQVCRFYGNGNTNPATGAMYGPNSHFYTADADECASLKAQFVAGAKSWKFESNDFLTTPAVGGACAAGLTPIYRAYNNGFANGIDSNHRITSDIAAYQQTVAAGWIGEGIVMCAPAGSAPTTGYAAHAEALARVIVESRAAAEIVDATRRVLVFGGLGVSGGTAPAVAGEAPVASWTVDSGIAFNLAVEAHDRATSGRATLAEVAKMWADFEFPFGGTGTPGEQLLGFLRESLLEARANPSAGTGFAPFFIAEMALRQQPPVDISSVAARADDLRLSLLEIELLHAMFDRAFQLVDAGSRNPLTLRATAADPFCDELKKFYGKIGTKIGGNAVNYVQGTLTEKALLEMGMSKADIASYAKFAKVFSALTSSLKVIKLAQIYAAGEVTLKVEGPNPVRKPPFNGARKLVPVKATAGVSEQEWQDYQKNNSSEAYQSVKSCLGSLGVPAPLDLKDIANKAGDWRVAWELTSGSPKHALLKTDVNDFNASSAGNPFGMHLVRSSPASADATLKVDVTEESQLATLFQGPIVTAKVRVRARIFTAEPPSPAMIAQVTSVMGTVAALVDLSAGWVQTMLPPTSTTVIDVEYHDVPLAIDATLRMAMTFNYPHFRGDKDFNQHSIGGDWSGKLTRTTRSQGGVDFEFYSGTGQFNYSGVSTLPFVDEDGCRTTYAYATRPGSFQMSVGPLTTLTGTILPQEPEQVGLGGGPTPPSGWPSEQKTITTTCPGMPPETTTYTMPFFQEIFVAATQAIILEDALFFTPSVSMPPGMYLNRGRLLADGTLELSYTEPKTVSVLVSGTPPLDTNIVAQDNLIRLRPVYAPQ